MKITNPSASLRLLCFRLCLAWAPAGIWVVNAQTVIHPLQPFFHHITVAEGLPSNEVHDVFQDSQGYIWFCTSNGLSRFNGQDFRNFNKSDGMCSSIVIGGSEDSRGRIWFFTSTSEIFYYDLRTGAFECPEFNATLSSPMSRHSLHYIRAFGDTLWFSVRRSIYGRITTSSGGGFQVDTFSTTSGLGIKPLKKDFAIFAISGKVNIKDSLQACVNGVVPPSKLITRSVRPSIQRIGNGYVAAIGKAVWLLDNEMQRKDFLLIDYDVVEICSYNAATESVVIGTYNGGFLEISAKDSLRVAGQRFKGYTVTAHFTDASGGKWVSTARHGVYYFPPSHHLVLTPDTTKSTLQFTVAHTEPRTGQIFAGGLQGGIYVFRPDRLHEFKKVFQFHSNEIRSIRTGPGNSVFFFGGPKTLGLDVVTGKTDTLREVYTTFYTDPDGRLMNINRFRRGLYFFPPGADLPNAESGPFWTLGNIKGAYPISDTTLYLLAHIGVAYVNTQKKEYAVIPFDLEGQTAMKASDLVRVSGDTFLLSTYGSGLFWLVGKSVVGHVSMADGLISDYCSSVASDPANRRVWVGTDLGMQPLVFSNGAYRPGQQYCPETGHAITHVRDLAVSGSVLFVVTESNAHVLLPSGRKGDSLCDEVRLVELSQRSKALQRNRNGVYEAPHTEGTVSIAFEQVCFQNIFHHLARYRIFNLDTEWVVNKSGNIFLQGLSPGHYDLEIQTMGMSGTWSERTLSIPFLIPPPFYATPWFVVLCIIIALALITVFVMQQRGNAARTATLRLSLLEAKNQSLSSQLNPHFLYNVLNTVGGAIARGNEGESLEIITRFSKLMRQVFSNSHQDLVWLEDELKAIESYVDLEKRRLGDQLDFRIVRNGTPVQSLRIPPLLLQPLVENAIWHGVSASGRPGAVELELRPLPGAMEIRIKNTGNEMDSARKKADARHRKSSLSVIIDRLELLKKIYGDNVALSYETEDKGRWATIARLTFPIVHR